MAGTDYLTRGKDSEAQIKSFYEFEKRKELNGAAVGRGVLLQHEEKLSVILGTKAMTYRNFRSSEAKSIQDWAHNMTNIKLWEISMRS